MPVLLRIARLANPRQLLSAQHVHDPLPADARPHDHPAGVVGHHLADDGRLAAERMGAHRRQRGVRVRRARRSQCALPSFAT